MQKIPETTNDELFPVLNTLAEWPHDVMVDIRRRIQADRAKVVVLDDDPTGTQTVHGIPVLTHWSVDALVQELCDAAPAFYLLTNSRALTRSDACRLGREIGQVLAQAAAQAGVSVEVISRSDSTLRGHFPHEVDAVAAAMGVQDRPYVLIPCFFEGGRYTVEDVHYVAEGQRMMPAAQTAYARDAAFGYTQSNLRSWVEEKTGGRIPSDQVTSISLEDLRVGGPDRVARLLTGVNPGSACVVNAVSYRDLEVFTLGALTAEQAGARFLYRTAASFVRVRCGISLRDLLQASELIAPSHNGGLFVVGSYVPKTTTQVDRLRAQGKVSSVEIEVRRLLDAQARKEEIGRAGDAVNRALGIGRDVCLFTSRELVKGSDAGDSLEIGRSVSDGLVEIIRGLDLQPRYFLAKGGITSSDMATKGLHVHRAMVMGQVLPGVPVWRLGRESRFPGMSYIVFPGNVGDRDALVEIHKRLRPGVSSKS
jgi:uncharacterized protein YgbK (DUF1537 family)